MNWWSYVILIVAVRFFLRHSVFVLSSVCPFVSHLLANLWTWYFENKYTDVDTNWHKWSMGQGMKLSPVRVRRSKFKVTKGLRWIWIILNPLGLSRFSGYCSYSDVARAKLLAVMTCSVNDCSGCRWWQPATEQTGSARWSAVVRWLPD